MARSLQWLRKTTPISAEHALDCFDLLSLPCVEHGADPTARASLLVTAIPAAIARVEDRLQQIVLACTFGAKSAASVKTRMSAARAEALGQKLIVAQTSNKTLEDAETQGIAALADVLRSYEFAKDYAGDNFVAEAAHSGDSNGFGYVILSRATRLRLDPTDPARQTYIRSLQVQSTGDQTRIVVFRFHWTGEGSAPLPVVLSTERGHSRLGIRQEAAELAANWYTVFFHLGRPLDRGEPTVLEWEDHFVDTKGSFDRQLTVHARFAETRRIETELEAPHLAQFIRVKGGAFRQDGDRLIPVGPQRAIVPDRGVFRYVKKNPVKNFHYGLHWEHAGVE